MLCFFFVKQKTAYEMRISDWSSDVCSSDLAVPRRPEVVAASASAVAAFAAPQAVQAFPVPDVRAQPVATMDRKPRLITQLKDLFEDVAGLALADADSGANFIELGLDSLMLTQVALQLQKSLGSKDRKSTRL